MTDPTMRGNILQARRNVFQPRRNKIQARDNEIQAGRNEIKMAFPSAILSLFKGFPPFSLRSFVALSTRPLVRALAGGHSHSTSSVFVKKMPLKNFSER